MNGGNHYPGCQRLFMRGFSLSVSKSYQESRENEFILSCLYILFCLPLIFILAFIKEQMVSYVFFFPFFLEEKAGGSSEKTPDNFGVSNR